MDETAVRERQGPYRFQHRLLEVAGRREENEGRIIGTHSTYEVVLDRFVGKEALPDFVAQARLESLPSMDHEVYKACLVLHGIGDDDVNVIRYWHPGIFD